LKRQYPSKHSGQDVDETRLEENEHPRELISEAIKEDSRSEFGIDVQRFVDACPVDHNGTTVYVKGWLMPTNERTALLIHDIGEEVGVYRETAIRLSKKGYNCYGFDLRGHGRSGRKLGHVADFRTLVQDLLQVVAWVKHREGGRLPLLVGQGVGALVAYSFANTYPKLVREMVLAAPYFEAKTKLTFVIRALAEVLPTLNLPKRLRPRFSDRRSSGSPVSAQLVREISRALPRTFNLPDGVRTLFICPTKDPICNYEKLRAWLILQGSDNVVLSDIQNCGHSILGEDPHFRDIAIEMILDWVKEGPLERLEK
jgi:alpha-beta hydrolase superfamily lysophospholipase